MIRVAIGLVSFVGLLNLAGFVAAGTVLFACTASAFGSRRWLRDALVGLTLCATVYITFTYGLGVSLPPGSVPDRALTDVDTLTALAGGFAVALTPQNLLWSLAGVTLGTAIGVLPGIGPALTVALLLPVTYSLDPTSAFIMFAGIYYGGMYGGSTTSILLNTPGESASVMSAVEGHLMARAGRGGAALATAAIGSFVAGTLGTAALTVCAPVMVEFALRFGPAEYFALAVLAFVAVSAMLGESRLNGFASLLFGLAARGDRHRSAHRRAAAHPRHPATARRHRRRRRRGRTVRRGRGAVHGLALPSRSRDRHVARIALDDP